MSSVGVAFGTSPIEPDMSIAVSSKSCGLRPLLTWCATPAEVLVRPQHERTRAFLSRFVGL